MARVVGVTFCFAGGDAAGVEQLRLGGVEVRHAATRDDTLAHLVGGAGTQSGVSRAQNSIDVFHMGSYRVFGNKHPCVCFSLALNMGKEI